MLQCNSYKCFYIEIKGQNIIFCFIVELQVQYWYMCWLCSARAFRSPIACYWQNWVSTSCRQLACRSGGLSGWCRWVCEIWVNVKSWGIYSYIDLAIFVSDLFVTQYCLPIQACFIFFHIGYFSGDFCVQISIVKHFVSNNKSINLQVHRIKV